MEKFDFVIIGGGHNGITTAAYLAKAGYKVVLAESRLELGGGMDFAEPMPGFHIQPHAAGLYARAAPGFKQLELWKYGFRVQHQKEHLCAITSDHRGLAIPSNVLYPESFRRDLEALKKWSKKDAEAWGHLFEGIFPLVDDLLTSVFYTPPWPREVDEEADAMDLPWVQVFKKGMGSQFSRDWVDSNFCEVIDNFLETGPLKSAIAFLTYLSAGAPHWEGVAIPVLAATMGVLCSQGMPVGGMHTYAHAIARCAFAHGARVITNSPVEEILVNNGRAVGVRLRDDSVYKNKVLLADKAVISCVDVQQTFLKFLGRDTQDPSFTRRISELSLKGGSVMYAHILCKEPPQFKGEAGKLFKDIPFAAIAYPVNSMDEYYQHMMTVDGRLVTPEVGHEGSDVKFPSAIIAGFPTSFDPNWSPDGHCVISPILISFPATSYHADGPDAVCKDKEKITAQVLDLFRDMATNMDEDNVIAIHLNTPLEEEFRNTGFNGGHWCNVAQSEDHWWTRRPLPELSRYRAPIENLYLGHQSQYPGALCMMAVPYDLMHILIDDGVVEAPSWWYPSPWHVKDGEHGVPRMEDVLKKKR